MGLLSISFFYKEFIIKGWVNLCVPYFGAIAGYNARHLSQRNVGVHPCSWGEKPVALQEWLPLTLLFAHGLEYRLELRWLFLF